MLRTAFATTCAPASAFSLVSAEAVEAEPAFLATSWTVAFISFMAVEVITAHWDGYSLGPNNFRIFHDKTTDRMVFLPQGLDQTFQRKEMPAQPDMNGLAARAVLEVPEFRARFRAREVELLTNAFQTELLVKRLREVAARVRREIGVEEPSSEDEYLKRAASYRRRIQQRMAALRRELKLETTETIAARKADSL